MDIKIIAAVTVGALTLISLLPLALPRHVHVERQAVLDASPSKLTALIASTEGYQTFNPFKDDDPNLAITPIGPAAGVGSGFRFEGTGGTGTQTVAKIDDTQVVMSIDMGAMGKPTQTFAFQAQGNSTQVTWSMDADLGYNPIARVFGLFMDSQVGPVFERGLANLSTATQS